MEHLARAVPLVELSALRVPNYLLFLRVSNYRNGGTLWVLDDRKATYFGNITRLHDYLAAKLFRQLRRTIGTIDCHIAYPGRWHARCSRRDRHNTALSSTSAARTDNRVGELSHRKILRRPAEQLRIKIRGRRWVGSYEFIPAERAMFCF